MAANALSKKYTQKRLEGGSRRWQNGTDIDDGKPLITIITSTFNAARDLPWTIRSIRAQTYPYIQWIVADGASKDGTIDLLRKNEDFIDVWFSEQDSGIYDAWNKALAYAKGEWVQFIGAGDELSDADTLEQMAPHLATAHPNHDIVYGRLAYVSENSRTLIEEIGVPWAEMRGKWECYRPKLPAHPEVFHHVSTFHKPPFFDTSYRIAADSHFLMQQLKNKEFHYVPLLIDRMPIGGISGKPNSFEQTLKETRRASLELGFTPPFSHLAFEHSKYALKWLLSRLLNEKSLRRAFDVFRLLTGRKRKWNKD